MTNATYCNYLITLFNKLKDTQVIARENLIQSKKRSKIYYDRKVKPRSFSIGDSVYLLKKPRKNKLINPYTGPYEMIEVLINCNVKLRVNCNKTRVVHIDKLKLA